MAKIQETISSLKATASTEWDLRYGRLGIEGAKAVVEALKQGENVQMLGLTGNQIRDEGAKAVAEALHTNSTVHVLHLGDNQIGCEGIKVVASSLHRNTTVHTLHLSGNALGDEGAKDVAEALRHNTTIHTLYLSTGKIGDEGAKALAEMLMHNSTLHTFDLNFNWIGAEGAQALAEGLARNAAVHTLTLSKNQIGATGAKALADGLKQNSTLRSLNLSNNHITDAGADSVAELITRNSCISALKLSGNSIHDQGLKAILESLKGNNTIQKLDLSNNEFGDDGAKAMADLLRRNTTIHLLHLWRNHITDEGATALAESLAENSSVRTIDLSGNEISKPILQAIAATVKRNADTTKPTLALKNGFLASPSSSTPPEVSPPLSPYASLDDSALGTSWRLGDVAHEDGNVRTHIAGLFRRCGDVVPVGAALLPVAHLLPDFAKTLDIVQRKARQLLRRQPGKYPGLDENLVAYLMFYTHEAYPQEMSVYCLVAAALHAERRDEVQPWVDYIWGLLHALKRLPPCEPAALYRSCRGAMEPLAVNYAPGEIVTWYGFSSCSEQQPADSAEGPRVTFQMRLAGPRVARNISDFLWCPLDGEILLPPGMKFRVERVTEVAQSATHVQLQGIGLEEQLIDF